MTTRRSILGAGIAFPFVQASRRRPNFIVIYTDDHGFGDLGCQGARDMKTPNFDALAAGGARFTNWYAAAPMCAPSRAALMPGRYPIRGGVPINGPSLPTGERTLADILKAQGYSTALFGKWHLGSDDQTAPNARGFERFFGFHSGCIDFYSHRYYWGEPRRVNYHDLWRNRTEVFEDGRYMTEMITAEARKFLLETRDKPFFLYLAYNAPHYPMHAPPKYVERFPELARERQMYAAMVAAVDDGVGEVMETLAKTGQRENTFMFYAADNGATREPRAGLDAQPAKGGLNGPLRGFKFSLFDGGMHVPAILNWPARIPPRQVIREAGCTIDVLPTFCRAAGAPLPPGRTIDGRDALPMAAEKAKSPHEALYWSSDGQHAVRRANWKLVMNGFSADGTPDGRRKLSGDDAMFLSDLDRDPGETNNLRRLHPGVVDELATLSEKWREEVKTP